MSDPVNGEPKIKIAKEVLIDLVKDLPNDTQAGLVVFGGSVRVPIPLGPLNKGKFIDEIQAIKANGGTPTGRAVQKTGEMIEEINEETIIILISDGEGGGDPCAEVKKLKSSGLNFTMYTIGFDVEGDAAEQLKCMANAGGGRYYTAQNANELKIAAKRAVSGGRMSLSDLFGQCLKCCLQCCS
jgi:Ca-activated chloride channel family protein